MNLLSHNQININPDNVVYKNSPLLAFIAFLIITGFSGIPIALWIDGLWPLGLVIVMGFFMLIISIIYFRSFLKTLKPDGWVVSLADNSLLIKFRSYQNTHLPKDDLQIVQIEYNEIVSFFIGNKMRITPSASGGKRYEFIKYLDLYLSCNTSALKAQLNHERNMNCGSRALHFYVFVIGENKVRIHWLDTQTAITPGLKHIAMALAAKNLYQIQDDTVEEKVPEKVFTEDTDILELYNNGYQVEAVSLARRLYGLNLTEAKSYVNKITDTNK